MAAAIDRAARSGRPNELAFLFEYIDRTLANTPRSWGDPRRMYRGMRSVLYERSMMSDGVRVYYMVHEVDPVVIVRSIMPIPDGPFDPSFG
jgi:hypothetical protein